MKPLELAISVCMVAGVVYIQSYPGALVCLGVLAYRAALAYFDALQVKNLDRLGALEKQVQQLKAEREFKHGLR
jgi:hypothetical protein